MDDLTEVDKEVDCSFSGLLLVAGTDDPPDAAPPPPAALAPCTPDNSSVARELPTSVDQKKKNRNFDRFVIYMR